MERRTLATGLGVAIASLGLGASAAGCGGSKSPTGAYRARAASLCKAEGKRLNSLSQPTQPSDIRPSLAIALPIIEQFINDLRQLDPPPALRADHARVVDLNKEEAQLIEAAITRLDGGADPSVVAASSLGRFDSFDKTESQVWNRLGVKQCATRFR